MLERAWLEAKERYTVTVERNQDYLKWRFLENPSIDYSVFTCFKDDSPCGFIIGRIESDQGFTMARIIDFITVEEAEIPLIENFVRWAYESDCDAVDFLFSW